MSVVYRQEIWLADLNPPGKGNDIHGYRPVLIVSVNELNNCSVDMVMAMPITSTQRDVPLQVKISPPEGGLKKTSYVKCDQIRTISKFRLKKRTGLILNDSMSQVEEALRILLNL